MDKPFSRVVVYQAHPTQSYMGSRTIRLGVFLGLVGFLLVFFLPVLPYTQPPGRPCAGICIGVFPVIPGYQSLGFYTTGWGAISGSWLAGYQPPAVTYDSGDGFSTLTASGVFLAVVLPTVVASIWLLGPELVRFSKISRIGFGVFGAAIFGLADLMLISMVQQASFPWLFVLVGTLFGTSGVLMSMYAMHAWPIGVWERGDSPGVG